MIQQAEPSQRRGRLWAGAVAGEDEDGEEDGEAEEEA